ncbi:hypothetical protein [Oceanithermus sp.]
MVAGLIAVTGSAVLGFWIGWGNAALLLGILAAGLAALRFMPCGKAGMFVFFSAGALVALNGMRAEIGEAAFYALLVASWTVLFLAYRRFALMGGCSGTTCRTG